MAKVTTKKTTAKTTTPRFSTSKFISNWMMEQYEKTKHTDEPRLEFIKSEIVTGTKLTSVQVGNALQQLRANKEVEIVSKLGNGKAHTYTWGLTAALDAATKVDDDNQRAMEESNVTAETATALKPNNVSEMYIAMSGPNFTAIDPSTDEGIAVIPEMSSGGNGGEIDPSNAPGNSPKPNEDDDKSTEKPELEPETVGEMARKMSGAPEYIDRPEHLTRRQRKQLANVQGTKPSGVVPPKWGGDPVATEKLMQAICGFTSEMRRQATAQDKMTREVIDREKLAERQYLDTRKEIKLLTDACTELQKMMLQVVEESNAENKTFRDGFVQGWESAIKTHNLNVPIINAEMLKLDNNHLTIDGGEVVEPEVYEASELVGGEIPDWSLDVVAQYMSKEIVKQGRDVFSFIKSIKRVKVEVWPNDTATIELKMESGADHELRIKPSEYGVK